MTIHEQILLVNSKNDAMNFWLNNFGEPDYFSAPKDADEIESLLLTFQEDLNSLENEIARTNTQNHFKLNKAISLHFVVNEGEHYLAALRISIENKFVAVEEKEYADEYGYRVDGDDPWREDSLFGEDEREDDDYETPGDWNLR